MSHRQLSAVQQQLAENATRYRDCLKWVLKHRIATYTTDQGEISLRQLAAGPPMFIPEEFNRLLGQIVQELDLDAEHAG